MQKNSQDFSMEDVMRLAESPAGQQLISMLQHSDTKQLQQVMNQASSGDYSQAGKTLKKLLSSPEAKQLLKELGG